MRARWYKLNCAECHELALTVVLPNSDKPMAFLFNGGSQHLHFDGYSEPSVLCLECTVKRAQEKKFPFPLNNSKPTEARE